MPAALGRGWEPCTGAALVCIDKCRARIPPPQGYLLVTLLQSTSVTLIAECEGAGSIRY